MIKFNNPKFLQQAFTHASYVNEHKNKLLKNNERLEFLGDAILELVISDYIFHRFSNMTEGEMTKLRAAIVCEPSLVSFANQLNFAEYILLGKGEEISGGRYRPALLADVFEAFIGALYLDQGIDSVKNFIKRIIVPHVENGEYFLINDYKSELQELVQHENYGTIEYQVIEEKGPSHEKEFYTEVLLNKTSIGSGSGRSKKEAEQQAAKKALSYLKLHMR